MRTTATVEDVMTREVVTVNPATPFKDLIEVLSAHSISAVPVVDGHGALVGVVSEADLLCRQEHQDDTAGSGPSFFAGRKTREHWRKASAQTAAGAMTSPPLTTTPETALSTAAGLLAQAGIRRLFVVAEGKLVGVLARRDVLSTFLRADGDIRAEINEAVFDHALHANRNNVLATVEHGVVLLTGRLEYEADVATAERRVESIPGVVEVRNRMDYVWNGQGVQVPV
jgi:CBS domain-containing protein